MGSGSGGILPQTRKGERRFPLPPASRHLRPGAEIMRLGQGISWTDENIAKLRDLAAQSFSSSQIAAAMPGATRSAIAGKAKRLGISLTGKHENQIRRTQRPKKPPNAKRSVVPAAPLPEPPAAPPESLNIPYSELPPGGCTFAVNDGAVSDLLFCGVPATPGKPYCAYHGRVASGGLPVRKRTAAGG